MRPTQRKHSDERPATAEIVREHGPFPGIERVHGVTFDGERVWFARGEGLVALDPESGARVAQLDVAADAGTAFDGRHLWQIAGASIHKIDPQTGRVLATLPAPGQGRDSGLTWAEGTLWVGEYRARTIHQIDAETGAVLRTIESDRFVTGVTWTDGALWHATLEDARSELRRVDPHTGAVLESYALPADVVVSGLEAGPQGVFFCGGGASGKLRVARKPR